MIYLIVSALPQVSANGAFPIVTSPLSHKTMAGQSRRHYLKLTLQALCEWYQHSLNKTKEPLRLQRFLGVIQ